jgi:uncharacterized protein (DUF2141 family)
LFKNIVFTAVYGLLIVCAFYACASIGSPEGGLYDLNPPQFVDSKPAPNSINFAGNKIELLFDEYISIEKPSEKVIITPPQLKTPVIKSVGKKITIELKDSLIPNTTYTFDFTDGIVDNNEKNALEGFTFAFSTGDVVDSLIISGILLNAENLEPVPNTIVGLHSDLADSAFTSFPFVRTSQTNDRGRFWVRNIAPGSYRIFALNDQNRNYQFDQPGEAIAFDERVIVPDFEPAIRMDTIWKDSLTVDTIKEVHYNRFIPDNMVLFLFKEGFEPQYLSKSERTSDKQFVLNFNSSKALPPEIRLLDNNPEEDWHILEFSPDKKSLTYWITDSLVSNRDTLRMEINYLADDSLNNLVSRTDTLQLYQRKKDEIKKKRGEEEKPDFLDIKMVPTGTLNVTDTLKITFSEPIFALDTTKIIFEQKVDTLWQKQNFVITQDSLNPRIFYLGNHWPYGQEYRITIDSASIYSVHNKWNDSINVKFKVPTEKEYGHLYVIMGDTGVAIVGQLLDASEKIVRESSLQNGELAFEYLKPGKYYLRCIEDLNENGKWDTGNYSEKRPPEPIYYYPTFIEVKEFAEIEQHWNRTETPVEKQKPLEITKAKPIEKRQPKREEQNTKSRNANTTNGSSMQKMPGMSRF